VNELFRTLRSHDGWWHADNKHPADILFFAKVYEEIVSDIDSIEVDEALGEAANFVARAEALDFIEFHIIDRIEGADCAHSLAGLKKRARSLKDRLEGVDEALFQEVRAGIRSGSYSQADAWRQLEGYSEQALQEDADYGVLDMFVNGLLRVDGAPEETRERSPEMVSLQPTPVKIVLELTKRANITQDDVFYDLGSGLGQVSILVNLLTGARGKGIEFEPAYCDHARRRARELGLDDVEFLNLDARDADYSAGTVFFMYTPFTGELLQEVLTKLRDETRDKLVRVWAYGPCILSVSRQSWLRQVERIGDQPEHALAGFESVRCART